MIPIAIELKRIPRPISKLRFFEEFESFVEMDNLSDLSESGSHKSFEQSIDDFEHELSSWSLVKESSRCTVILFKHCPNNSIDFCLAIGSQHDEQLINIRSIFKRCKLTNGFNIHPSRLIRFVLDKSRYVKDLRCLNESWIIPEEKSILYRILRMVLTT